MRFPWRSEEGGGPFLGAASAVELAAALLCCACAARGQWNAGSKLFCSDAQASFMASVADSAGSASLQATSLRSAATSRRHTSARNCSFGRSRATGKYSKAEFACCACAGTDNTRPHKTRHRAIGMFTTDMIGAVSLTPDVALCSPPSARTPTPAIVWLSTRTGSSVPLCHASFLQRPRMPREDHPAPPQLSCLGQ